MSGTVYLHVGLPKSGTSYVQGTLTANKDALKRAGLLFPGRGWVDQVRAVQDVRQMKRAPAKRRRVAGAWQRLVAEISAWHGDAIVSMEWLGPASADHIRTMVSDLRPARVHVIFTVRDLARTVPAAWQEFVQNREEWTWQEFLEGVVAEGPTKSVPGSRFWAQQDLAGLLATWTSVVPAEDVHVVTVPRPGVAQDVLWQRLCEVLGPQYEGCRSTTGASNRSLGMESAELMRRLNRAARAAELPTSVYLRRFKHALAKGILAQRSGEESKLVLPPAYDDWATRAAAHQIEAVGASGVHVVGDLEDLRPVPAAADAPQPGDVPVETLLDICLEALVAQARHKEPDARLRRENNRLRRRVTHFESRPGRAALRLHARKARARLRALRRPRGVRGRATSR
jgi:hypothetical protein